MEERITIENFAGIEKLELEFKRINILIGPQASGKSITVKLSYFFKNFISEIFKSIDKGESKRQLDKRQLEKFHTYFPKESWPKGSFRIEYRMNESVITIHRKRKSLFFDYSDDLKEIFSKGKQFYKEEQKNVKDDPRLGPYRISNNARRKFLEYVGERVSPSATYNQYFIPAGRSFFANIQSGIFSFLSDNRSLDPFLIEFGSFYGNFKLVTFGFPDEKKTSNREFEKLSAQVINGSYLREKDKDYLVHSDLRKVNLANASSGQQETLPLVLVLKTFNGARFTGAGATLYIEEPEAHLFPIAQKRIVQLLARTFNSVDTKFQIIVTTHSPYILSSFNNLIEAGKIIQDKPDLKKKVAAIVPEEEIINPNDLIAYSIKDGEKTVLIDDNTKLISQNLLDSVSDEIALEFGKLIDLEF